MERLDDTERYGKGESKGWRLRREEDDLDSFPTVRGNRRAGLLEAGDSVLPLPGR